MATGLGSSGDGRTTGGSDSADGTAPLPRLPGERSRHRQGYWIVAGTAAGLVGLAGGAFALLAPQAPQQARVAAADCGLVRCSATLPPTGEPSPAANAKPNLGGRHHPATARTTPSASTAALQQAASGHSGSAATPPAPVQHPTTRPPTPRPARSPAPPPGPPVTVTFTVDQSQNGWGGERFTGQFTVVNHTGAAVTGWTLQAGLASAHVRWVSTSGNGWPEYPSWYQTQNGVVISGPQPSEALTAHGTAVFYLSGWGSTSLASCSFDGASC